MLKPRKYYQKVYEHRVTEFTKRYNQRWWYALSGYIAVGLVLLVCFYMVMTFSTTTIDASTCAGGLR